MKMSKEGLGENNDIFSSEKFRGDKANKQNYLLSNEIRIKQFVFHL